MKPIVRSAPKRYTPFGSVMQGRAYSSAAFRFGFNGQEKDGELGDAYAFKYRIHNASLGRFFSVDPLSSKFPSNSNYAFAENKIIWGRELEGLEVVLVTKDDKILSGPFNITSIADEKNKKGILGPYLKEDYKETYPISIGAVAASDIFKDAQLLQVARDCYNKSDIFKELLKDANISDKTVSYRNELKSEGLTLPKTGNILLRSSLSSNEESLKRILAFELINSANVKEKDDLAEKARKNEITEDDYVKGILKSEAKSYIGSAFFCKDIGINSPALNSVCDNVKKFGEAATIETLTTIQFKNTALTQDYREHYQILRNEGDANKK